jgi:hypothetical protein
LKIWLPHQICMLKFSPQHYGIWKWVPQRWSGYGGRLFMNRISVLIKETPEIILALFVRWGQKGKKTVYDQLNRSSSDSESANTWIFHFQPRELEGNYCLWYSVTATEQTKTDINHIIQLFWFIAQILKFKYSSKVSVVGSQKEIFVFIVHIIEAYQCGKWLPQSVSSSLISRHRIWGSGH